MERHPHRSILLYDPLLRDDTFRKLCVQSHWACVGRVVCLWVQELCAAFVLSSETVVLAPGKSLNQSHGLTIIETLIHTLRFHTLIN